MEISVTNLIVSSVTNKQLVISVPEIWVQERTKDVEFLFIAWDGIWEWMSSKDVVSFFHSKQKKISKGKISESIESLLLKNLANDVTTSCGKGLDNMTGILITIN